MRDARLGAGRPWQAAFGFLLLACSCAAAPSSDRGRDETRQARADTRLRAPPATTEGARLRGSYVFAGRRRRFDAQITFDHPIDPYRASAQPPVAGARLVAVHMKLLNRGPDPFPLGWALLRGYDEHGRPLPAGSESTPLRKTLPQRPMRGQTLTRLTAFRVPRGRRLASIEMSSIVDLWRFHARWTMAGSTLWRLTAGVSGRTLFARSGVCLAGDWLRLTPCEGRVRP